MPAIEVRPLRRGDRDQLTELVNAHVQAVVPGLGVSVATVMTALERQPAEFIEDPWVSERVTLVALQRGRVANGTRLIAVLGGHDIGYLETGIFDDGERTSRHGSWADIGNLHVRAEHRRRGVASWLLGQAAGWLELAHVDRLLGYAWLNGPGPDHAGYRAFLAAAGFQELTRTRRGWARSLAAVTAAAGGPGRPIRSQA